MDGLSERRTAQLPQAWGDRALNFAEIRSGEDTIMFWATVDSAGRVVGGVRAKGLSGSADDSHAVIEWADNPACGSSGR